MKRKLDSNQRLLTEFTKVEEKIHPKKRSRLIHPKWSYNFVKFPHHPKNTFKQQKKLKKWYLITTLLSKKIRSGEEFVKVIMKILGSEKYVKQFENGVGRFFDEVLSLRERTDFFERILPKIQKMVVRTPKIFNYCESNHSEKEKNVINNGSCDVGILGRERNGEIVLSREKILCLLCNSFFCTFPNQESGDLPDEGDINFYQLYVRKSDLVFEKMKCLISYFDQCLNPCEEEFPDVSKFLSEKVTFKRCSVDETEIINSLSPNSTTVVMKDEKRIEWSKYDVEIFQTGKMEDYGVLFNKNTNEKDASFVDFANRNIGGGVLGKGAVQEEILFLIFPECIISRLFCERMKNKESLIISNVMRFSNYRGYSKGFQFDGKFNRKDTIGRFSMICIDAVNYSNYRDPFRAQFKKALIDREIVKCYSGFKNCETKTIVSGNWGCGAFKGDHQLKCIIQIILSKCSEKKLVYFTFGRREIVEMKNFVKFINDLELDIEELYQMLLNYYQDRLDREDLFSFVQRKLVDDLDW